MIVTSMISLDCQVVGMYFTLLPDSERARQLSVSIGNEHM